MAWLKSHSPRPHNVVHPRPHIDWHQTSADDSGSESEIADGPRLGVVEAALFMLEDKTLAAGGKSPEKQQKQPPGVGTVAAQDWDAFVQKCLAGTQKRAAVSFRLLAMRDAVPSASARLVFQSQVCTIHQS